MFKIRIEHISFRGFFFVHPICLHLPSSKIVPVMDQSRVFFSTVENAELIDHTTFNEYLAAKGEWAYASAGINKSNRWTGSKALQFLKPSQSVVEASEPRNELLGSVVVSCENLGTQLYQ